MASGFDFQVQAPGQETMAGMNQAVGMIDKAQSWANQQATLDIQKQDAQNRMQQTQLMRDQFDNHVNDQQFNDLKGGLTLPVGSKSRKAYYDMIQSKYENTHKPIHDASISMFNDSEIQPDLYKIMQGATDLKSMNPDAYNQALGTGMAYLRDGQIDKFLTEGTDLAKAHEQAKATQNRLEATNERFNQRLSAAEVNKGVQMAGKSSENDNFILSSAARLQDYYKGATTGDFVNTKQVLAKLQTEEQKIQTGLKTTEGAQERQKYESWLGGVSDIVQKLSALPAQAPVADFEKQISQETNNMTKSYMTDIDSRHEAVRGGFEQYPKAQQAIDTMFRGIRSSNARPERFGKWMGYNQDGVPQKNQQAAPPQPAPAQGASNQAPSPAAQQASTAPKPFSKEELLQLQQSDPKTFDQIMNGLTPAARKKIMGGK